MPLPSHESQPLLFLVEDEPDTADLLKLILQEQGYLVVHAADGQEALDKLMLMPPPTLVLLDIQLPHVDGVTILETIRATPDWQEVPVVMLTAMADAEYVLKVTALKIGGYILKPFKRETLLRAIQRALTTTRP